MQIVQGPRADKSSSGRNAPIDHLVVHSAVAPCAPGVARRIAAYFASDAAGGSAHYTIDPDEIVQSLPDDVIAWHAPPNQRSLGFEMCDQPADNLDRWYPGKGMPKGTDRGRLRFIARPQRRMLRRTADLVATKAVEHDVPFVFLEVADLRAGKRGVTTHANKSEAFGQSDHWDPGSWPRRAFMRRGRKTYRKLSRKKTRP